MSFWTCLAASTSSVPAGTSTFTPSIVTVAIFFSGILLLASRVRLDVFAEVTLEAFHDRAEERFDRIAERTQVESGDLVRDVDQHFDVAGHAFAFQDALEHQLEPVAAFTARRALPTRFMREETHQCQRSFYEIGRIVEDDDGARAQHRSVFGHVLVIVRDVEMLFEQTSRAAAARLHRQEFASVAQTAGAVIDQLTQRRSERNFIVAGFLHVSANGNDLVTLGFLGTDARKPLRAVAKNRHQIRQRFRVVHDGRFSVQPLDGWERRLETRFAAFTLERAE